MNRKLIDNQKPQPRRPQLHVPTPEAEPAAFPDDSLERAERYGRRRSGKRKKKKDEQY